jgi:hypothetical protein
MIEYVPVVGFLVLARRVRDLREQLAAASRAGRLVPGAVLADAEQTLGRWRVAMVVTVVFLAALAVVIRV